nr:ghrelin O-acyltransferase [Pogona vitticeps]
MTWQTLCHFWLQYKEYYLQETACTRFSINLSALMLMSQKVTSLALDIHERKVRKGHLLQALPFLTYLLSFPTLLGGPLCSFNRFQTWIRCSRGSQADLTSCAHFGCISVMWTSALVFRLTYYSHWMLDESLLLAAGLGLELGQDPNTETVDGLLIDTDIWTLETTHMVSVFTRTWNKSTAQWPRRLIFQRNASCPLLATSAFSAWWHGLHPDQVFGFLCWAVVVEAEYHFHHFFGTLVKSPLQRRLYQTLTWCYTQLVVAYIMMAIEMRSLPMLRFLLFSYNSFFPLVYFISLLLLAKGRGGKPATPHSHISCA